MGGSSFAGNAIAIGNANEIGIEDEIENQNELGNQIENEIGLGINIERGTGKGIPMGIQFREVSHLAHTALRDERQEYYPPTRGGGWMPVQSGKIAL